MADAPKTDKPKEADKPPASPPPAGRGPNSAAARARAAGAPSANAASAADEARSDARRDGLEATLPKDAAELRTVAIDALLAVERLQAATSEAERVARDARAKAAGYDRAMDALSSQKQAHASRVRPVRGVTPAPDRQVLAAPFADVDAALNGAFLWTAHYDADGQIRELGPLTVAADTRVVDNGDGTYTLKS